MKFAEHLVFLIWLLYATVVGFAAAVATAYGLPQTILHHDHAHLGMAMLCLYLVAEAIAGWQAFRVSQARVMSRALLQTLERHAPLRFVASDTTSRGLMFATNGGGMLRVGPGPLTDGLRGLVDMHERGAVPSQDVLLSLTAARLHARVALVEFIAGRIVWIGILATVVGVIMAFWPFIAAGADLERLRSDLSGFFAGVAVAFIPTALSFVLKIALDTSARIVEMGVDWVLEDAALVGETHVIPALSKQGRAV